MQIHVDVGQDELPLQLNTSNALAPAFAGIKQTGTEES